VAESTGNRVPSPEKTLNESLNPLHVKPYSSPQVIQDYYDRKGKLDKKKTELDLKKIKPSEFPKAEYERFAAVGKKMTDLKKKETELLSSNIDAATKRQRLDTINRAMIAEAKKVIKD
jgi:hypothetical protein